MRYGPKSPLIVSEVPPYVRGRASVQPKADPPTGREWRTVAWSVVMSTAVGILLLGILSLIGGCSAPLAKQSADKVADIAIAYCATTSEAERVIFRGLANDATRRRCAEKNAERKQQGLPALPDCPQECISCSGTGRECIWYGTASAPQN